MESYNHIQTAHCENGVTLKLLREQGVDFLTEPLAFGLGGGIFYIHIPFLKVNGAPAISFRSFPGSIFKRTCKSLNVDVKRQKFKSETEAQNALDQLLQEGKQVGCQVGVFNLGYFPPEYRFHFNAHNLIVYGKNEEGNYLISDPVMEGTTVLTPAELNKVRFAKGALAPNGHLYYPEASVNVSQEVLRKGISKSIKKAVGPMIKAPGGIIGTNGIKYTAGKIRKWRSKLGERKAGLYLGQIVRMQEEIGTGGGGFRFLYAAYLQEASEIMQNDQLLKISDEFTRSGDLWRDSAVQMAGIYKGRLTAQSDFERSAEILEEIAEVEKNAFKQLDKIKFK